MSVTTTENAIALRFADRAPAYQVLSELKHLNSATTEVRGAVLIERTQDGTVHFPEGMDTEAGRGTAVGSLVGSLVGILGGPLGLLMGWGIGALIGGGHDYKRATEATEAVGAFTPHVPPGGTVILAGVEEADTEAMNLLAMRYGATLERRPADDVRAELKAMEKAVDEIRKQEAKDKRDRKRDERGRKADERKSKDGTDTPGPNLAPADASATDAG
ncbi:histidine kinase [Streptomyces sp. NBC_00444]|uniref:histidine kinase n=1 Tax=Streptomyces sp. NBC_00444 TaxID=2975744 RepID=UPI002E215279